MDPISSLIDFILHLDSNLAILIQQFGLWTYIILFIIIFCETGLVIAPFFPGDSLIFAAGALSAMGALDPLILFIVLSAAAIIGDTINYWIGHFIGPKVFKQKSRFFKKEHLERAQTFYKKHGGKTIFLARFIPIIRTFAPFVAGIGIMNYRRFIFYNIIGGISWVAFFLLLGFWFGNLPVVKGNFALLIIAIIVISLLPFAVGYLYEKKYRKTKS
jgi:membrane-associated protein